MGYGSISASDPEDVQGGPSDGVIDKGRSCFLWQRQPSGWAVAALIFLVLVGVTAQVWVWLLVTGRKEGVEQVGPTLLFTSYGPLSCVL